MRETNRPPLVGAEQESGLSRQVVPPCDGQTGRGSAWRRVKRWLGAVLLIVALGAVGVAATDQTRWRRAAAAARGDRPAAAAEALRWIAAERERRAADVVIDVLKLTQDRQVLDQAAYAASRVLDERSIDLLRQRADEPNDDPTRARLLMFAGRLARPQPAAPAAVASTIHADAPAVEIGPAASDSASAETARTRSWLLGHLNGSDSWAKAGAAIGLLEMGELAGGPPLTAIAQQIDHPARDFARIELQRIASMMIETVGYPLTWPADWPQPAAEPAADFWAALDEFWARHATPRLLSDVLEQRYGNDPRWVELRRLLHARDKVARLFE